MQITTLVPAFKPQYLSELLTCLQTQTHRPARVIISDDSPDAAFMRILAEPQAAPVVQALNLQVVRGPQRGPWANGQHLMALYGGATPLFHLLMDDDILYPSFYARHVQAHQAAHALAAVSRRWYARDAGQPVGDLPVPAAIDMHAHRLLPLGPALLFSQIAGTGNNWLGEFSNTTFRAEMAPFFRCPEIAGLMVSGLQDIGAMLAASLQAPLLYLNEHLGYFRTSATQNSAQPRSRAFKQGVLAWIPLAIAGRTLGHLDAAQAQAAIARTAHHALERYGQEPDLRALCASLPALIAGSPGAEAAFLTHWQALADPRDTPPLESTRHD